jgi:hypothetical protein
MATRTLYIYFKNKDRVDQYALFCRMQKASAEKYFQNYDPAQLFKLGFTKFGWISYQSSGYSQFSKYYLFYGPVLLFTHSLMNVHDKNWPGKWSNPFFKLIERGRDENIFKDVHTFHCLHFVVGCEGAEKCASCGLIDWWEEDSPAAMFAM